MNAWQTNPKGRLRGGYNEQQYYWKVLADNQYREGAAVVSTTTGDKPAKQMTGVTEVKCFLLKMPAIISLLESINWIPIQILYVHVHLKITQWHGYVASRDVLRGLSRVPAPRRADAYYIAGRWRAIMPLSGTQGVPLRSSNPDPF